MSGLKLKYSDSKTVQYQLCFCLLTFFPFRAVEGNKLVGYFIAKMLTGLTDTFPYLMGDSYDQKDVDNITKQIEEFIK